MLTKLINFLAPPSMGYPSIRFTLDNKEDSDAVQVAE